MELTEATGVWRPLRSKRMNYMLCWRLCLLRDVRPYAGRSPSGACKPCISFWSRPPRTKHETIEAAENSQLDCYCDACVADLHYDVMIRSEEARVDHGYAARAATRDPLELEA